MERAEILAVNDDELGFAGGVNGGGRVRIWL